MKDKRQKQIRTASLGPNEVHKRKEHDDFVVPWQIAEKKKKVHATAHPKDEMN